MLLLEEFEDDERGELEDDELEFEILLLADDVLTFEEERVGLEDEEQEDDILMLFEDD